MHTDRLLVATLALTLAQSLSAQTHVYVDDDAPAGGDGLSWQSAFNDLHDAIELAKTLGQNRGEIRIAGGVYQPDQGTLDPFRSFTVPVPGPNEPQLHLKGGYAGLSNPALPDTRNPQVYPSTIDADLLGNDTSDPASRTDNTRVLLGIGEPGSHSQGVLSAITLEGLNFRGASDGAVRGFASVVSAITITFQSCRFFDNHAAGGSAIGLARVNVDIRSCEFIGNRSAPSPSEFVGGAVSLVECAATVLDSSFSLNTTTSPGAGAIWLSQSSIAISGSSFTGNYANDGGAAISSLQSQVSIGLSDFTANTAGSVGLGGAIRLSESAATSYIEGCSFHANDAEWGGAVYSNAQVRIEHSEFQQNTATIGGALVGGGSVQLSSFDANTAALTGGAALLEIGTVVVGCSFTQNQAGTDAGALAIGPDDASNTETRIYNAEFIDNSAGGDGGAILGDFTITNSRFESNSSRGNGGAIAGARIVRDSTIHDNAASRGLGGGLYDVGQIVECEVTDNYANTGGGIANASLIEAVYLTGNFSINSGGALALTGNGDTMVRNSVFFNNSINSVNIGTEIAMNSTGRLDVQRTTILQNLPIPRLMMTLGDGETWIESSIIWSTNTSGAMISVHESPVAFIYNNIRGGTNGVIPSTSGDVFFLGGMMNADPRFVDPAAGNVRLSPGSPCIDAGYLFGNQAVGEDVYGGSRNAFNDQGMPNIGQGANGSLDIGANEFRGRSCFADLNADGTLTPADFSAWIAAYNAGSAIADQNRDGDLTVADFSAWIANYNNGCP